MKIDITVNAILNSFSGLEKEHNLFDKKVRGVYFWQLLRFSLYMELAQIHSHAEDAYKKLSLGISAFFRKSFVGFTMSPFLHFNKKCDVLICSGVRNIESNNGYYSIWTYPLEEELEQKSIPYLVFEVRDTRGKYTRKGNNIIYHERRNIFSLLDYIKVWFDKPEKGEIKKALEGITDIAGIPVSELKTLSEDSIAERISIFRLQEAFYTKILKKFKPKKVYLVSGWLSMIAACKKLRIETIELQHGIMPKFTFPYDSSNSSIYFPDNLCLWGQYWYNSTPLPVPQNRVTFTGYKYLKDELNKYHDVEVKNNRILFLSSLRKQLVDIAIKFAEINPHFDVVVRLHPSETLDWRKGNGYNIELAATQERLNNLDVEVANEVPLYKSLKLSCFSVGIFSTACMESIATGCKCILVSDNIAAMHSYLLGIGVVPVVDNEKELSDIVNSKKDYWKDIDINYFFAGTVGSDDSKEVEFYKE